MKSEEEISDYEKGVRANCIQSAISILNTNHRLIQSDLNEGATISVIDPGDQIVKIANQLFNYIIKGAE